MSRTNDEPPSQDEEETRLTTEDDGMQEESMMSESEGDGTHGILPLRGGDNFESEELAESEERDKGKKRR